MAVSNPRRWVFDERMFQSDMLPFPLITHWSSPCSCDHSKVSVKPWEVQCLFLLGAPSYINGIR